MRRTIRCLIPKWRSCISLETEDGWKREFRRGIYQGALSPLLFCLAVSPLSEALRERVGFQSKFHVMPVTHQMYVDDLKLYAESKEMLERMVGVTEEVSAAVGMEFGLKKCAVAHLINNWRGCSRRSWSRGWRVSASTECTKDKQKCQV